MYLFSICRDLAKSTFTHVPCGTTWKGRENIEEHLTKCDAELTQVLDEIYQVPGLPDVTLTFGWALFFDGLWHNEVMRLLYISRTISIFVFAKLSQAPASVWYLS